MIKTHTEIPTDIINNQSDMNMGGTGIGNSSPSINLDEINKYNTRNDENGIEYTNKYTEETDPFSPFDFNITKNTENFKSIPELIRDLFNNNKDKDKEENQEKIKTQGELEQELYEIMGQLDKLQEQYEELNNFSSGDYKDRNYVLSRLTDEELKSLGITKTNSPHGQGVPIYTGLGKDTFNQAVELLRNRYSQEMTNIRNRIEEIKNHENFDNRTDSQIREDLKDSTAYQTVVEDMRKAGLNPAMIGGVGYAGGGGGGSSKAEEEEEKRKRKRLELLERQRAEQLRQQQQAMQILGMLTGMSSFLGSAAIRNAGYTKFWEAQMAKNATKNTTNFNQPSMKINTKQHTTRNEPDWLEKYLKEIEEMG